MAVMGRVFLLAAVVGAATATAPLGWVAKEADVPTHNAETSSWLKGGPAAAEQKIDLTAVLRVEEDRKQALEQTLFDVSNPDSPRYGQHLSIAAITELLDVPAERVRIVQDYFESFGAKVTVAPNRDVLNLKMTVSAAERALSTVLHTFRHREARDIAIVRAASAYFLPQAVAEHVVMVGELLQFPRKALPCPPPCDLGWKGGSAAMERKETRTDFQEKVSSKSWRSASHDSFGEPTIRLQTTGLASNQGQLRLVVSRVLRSTVFEAGISILIMTSFVLMVIEADYGAEIPMWMRQMNLVLLLIYTFEVLVRVWVYRRRFFRSSFNILDICIVVAELVTQVLDAYHVQTTPSVVILRIFRTLRLSRGVKVITQCPQLALMVKGLVNGTSAALYGAALMMVMLTIWSVCAVQFINPVNERIAKAGIYDDCHRCAVAFSTVRHSMLSFLQQIVMGDAWGEVIIPIVEEAPETAIFFGMVFVSVQFTIMNVILAVIVDIALKASQDDITHLLKKKEDEYKAAAYTLQEICQEMDEDGSGDLTESELVNGFTAHEDFRNILLAMDIGKEDMHIVFSILDSDLNGTVNYDEFIQELFKMKKHDSHTLLVFIKHYVTEIRKDVQEQMKVLKKELFSGMKSFASEHGTVMNVTSTRASEADSRPSQMGDGALGSCSQGLSVTFQPTRPSGSIPEVPEHSMESLKDIGEELRNMKKSISDDLRHSMKDIVRNALQPIRVADLSVGHHVGHVIHIHEDGQERQGKQSSPSKDDGSSPRTDEGANGGAPRFGSVPHASLEAKAGPQKNRKLKTDQSAWAMQTCCTVQQAQRMT